MDSVPRLIVASFSRAKTQITLRNLPAEILKRVELWVVPSQKKEYAAEGYKVGRLITWPDDVDAIYKKRKFLSETVKEPFLMLDDDLQLMRWSRSASRYVIASEDPTAFVRVFDRHLLKLFDSHDSVSCSQKFMADQYVREHGLLKEGVPGFVVSGYNPGACDEVDFTRTTVLSDMNQGIQSLQTGKTSVTYFGIVFSQSNAKSLASSGCGSYRSTFMKVDAALRFLHYYPGIVTDFHPTKTENGGGLKLVKFMGRLKTGVKQKHRLESAASLERWVKTLGMDRPPKRLRWRMEEKAPQLVNRLQSAWQDAGFSGDFNNLPFGVNN